MIIILNGTSSAGKTTLSKTLQSMLPEPFLHVGIDTFIDIMPQHLNQFAVPNQETIGFWCRGTHTPLGEKVDKIVQGKYAQHISQSYRSTVVHLLNEGHNIVLDEVFLDGRQSYETWQSLLEPFSSILVGVCPPLIASEQREKDRGDRRIGTARSQYYIIHEDIPYDLVIDNEANSNEECARQIIKSLYE